MDKPTPPKTITTRMLGTGPEVEFVFLTDAIAHGEAMAAWSAAQERERLQALINELLLSDQTPTAVQSKEIDRDDT